MGFEKIIGQTYVLNSLINSIKNNSVPHAYIFEGQKEIGKKTVAKEFSNILVCEEHSDNTCNNCNSCRLTQSGNHPDIKFVSGESSIGVDLIRDMVKDTSIKPYYGQRKIYIIEDADKMTTQAQNSLLKTLEEPPEYVIIILTTTNINSILPTILSRCIIKKFIRNTNDEIENFIVSRYNDIKNPKLIASLSDGAIGNAIELIESENINTLRQQTFEIINKVFSSNKLEALSFTKFFDNNKDNIDLILQLMLLWFRDILILRETNDNILILNIDYIDKIRNLVQIISSEKAQVCINSVLETKKGLMSNANFSLAIEVMLLNFKV